VNRSGDYVPSPEGDLLKTYHPSPALTCGANLWRRVATQSRLGPQELGKPTAKAFAHVTFENVILNLRITPTLIRRKSPPINHNPISRAATSETSPARKCGVPPATTPRVPFRRHSPHPPSVQITHRVVTTCTYPDLRACYSKPMSHTYCAQFVHVVFSTKERRDLIPPNLEPRLIPYLAGTIKKLGLDSLAIGGTANHLHILMLLRPTIRVAEAVQKIKANTSRWLGEQGIQFEWQKGYGVFSVSPSMLPTVAAYIENQKEHHRARTFENEFLALLRKSGVQFDEADAFR
jgi:putative transposase